MWCEWTVLVFLGLGREESDRALNRHCFVYSSVKCIAHVIEISMSICNSNVQACFNVYPAPTSLSKHLTDTFSVSSLNCLNCGLPPCDAPLSHEMDALVALVRAGHNVDMQPARHMQHTSPRTGVDATSTLGATPVWSSDQFLATPIRNDAWPSQAVPSGRKDRHECNIQCYTFSSDKFIIALMHSVCVLADESDGYAETVGWAKSESRVGW